MDSGNSGSMQSSSGGDEEYDSRSESISAFLNPQSSHLGPLPNHLQPPHHHHHQTQSSSSSSMFDPLSNYFDPLSSSRSVQLTNPNSLLNLDMVWSKTLRSDSNATDLCGLITPSSSAQSQPFLTNQLGGGQSRDGSFCAIQIAPAPENSPRASVSAASGSISGANDQAGGNNTNVVRNPKKRSRASRRAPTTVLTTDTTNFRAMVQEFTGIPAPPFTSSPFPRSRLDLFGTSSSSLRSGHLDPAQPPYLLRPFAQKIQPPPFLSSSPSSSSSAPSLSFPSSMIDVLGSDSRNNASHSTAINYQLSSDLGVLKQPHNLLDMNMQNPILNLQTLLQSQPKYTQSTSAILGSKTQGSLEIPPNDSHLKMGNVLEELGLSHQHVGTQLSGLSNIVSADGTFSRNENNPPTSWPNDTGTHGGDHQGFLRSLNGSYGNSERITNGKTLNYSAASSSDFHGDKGPENVATRSEGMVESWICSSD